MYNVNPDITVNNPEGGTWYMPGLLAKRYEAMGGRVTYFGKPHKVTQSVQYTSVTFLLSTTLSISHLCRHR